MLSEVRIGKDRVAFKLDGGDSESGTLVDLERKSDGGCRDLLDDRFDFCFRSAFVRKHLFDYSRRAFCLDRVILGLFRKPNGTLPKFLQKGGLLYGLQALILDVEEQ